MGVNMKKYLIIYLFATVNLSLKSAIQASFEECKSTCGGTMLSYNVGKGACSCKPNYSPMTICNEPSFTGGSQGEACPKFSLTANPGPFEPVFVQSEEACILKCTNASNGGYKYDHSIKGCQCKNDGWICNRNIAEQMLDEQEGLNILSSILNNFEGGVLTNYEFACINTCGNTSRQGYSYDKNENKCSCRNDGWVCSRTLQPPITIDYTLVDIFSDNSSQPFFVTKEDFEGLHYKHPLTQEKINAVRSFPESYRYWKNKGKEELFLEKLSEENPIWLSVLDVPIDAALNLLEEIGLERNQVSTDYPDLFNQATIPGDKLVDLIRGKIAPAIQQAAS